MFRTFIDISRRQTVFAYMLLVGVTCCVGCGSKSSSMAAVRGKVRLDDKPLSNGFIVTLPTSGRGAKGTIRNGEFELGTFSTNDGAVIGTHKVSISANESSQGAGPEAGAGKSLLADRFSNPETSGLTIEVKAGEVNTPTLTVTSK